LLVVFNTLRASLLLFSACASPSGAYGWNTARQIAVRDFRLTDLRSTRVRDSELLRLKAQNAGRACVSETAAFARNRIWAEQQTDTETYFLDGLGEIRPTDIYIEV